MPTPEHAAFSLRPWPTSDKKPKSLGEFIARVKMGPGGFRGVSEEALRKQIESGVAKPTQEEEIDVDESESESNDESMNVTAETIRKAREDVLKNIEVAHQNAMLTQDLISLLLSKEDPTNAARTLSPSLRDLVGIGTLGADKLSAPQTTPARILDAKMTATGWKFIEIKKSMDMVLGAASRLQKEITLETKYWAEVLAVTEKGWSVCRLPREKQTLGVRFGFSESAPEFRNNNLAPMRRSEDGSVVLDAPKVAAPHRVRISIEKGGRIVGRSALPKALAKDAPLESRVLEARNTTFHQELWHEINREARTILSHNVRMSGESVTYDISENTKAVITMCNLDDDVMAHESTLDVSSDDDESDVAETLSIALSLLLSHAHRLNLHVRSQPGPPQVRKSRVGQPYALIRPLIAFLEYEAAIEKATLFISDVTCVLQSAGYSSASFVLSEPPLFSIPSMASRRQSSSEALLNTFLNPREFQLELAITPTSRVLIIGMTQALPHVVTTYNVRLPPPTSAEGEELPQENVLRTLFPPSEIYPNLREATQWLAGAVTRVMADEAAKVAFEFAKHSAADLEERVNFTKNLGGTAVTGVYPDRREIEFNMLSCGDTEMQSAGLGSPELRVFAAWPTQEGQLVRKEWNWTAEEARSGVSKEKVESIQDGVLRGNLSP